MIIRRLDLTYNLIAGTIPSAMGLMTGLAFLSLQSNAFVGTIPVSLTALSQLT